MSAYIRQTKAFALALALVCAMTFGFMGVTQAYADDGDAADTSTETTSLANGTYLAPNIESSLGMYNFDATTAKVIVDGDQATLVTTVTDSKTINRYADMAAGKYADIIVDGVLTDESLKATVTDETDADGNVTSRTFSLPIATSTLEAGDSVYYVLRYRDGYSDTHDGDWYAAKSDHYFTVGELTPVATVVDLYPTNEEIMWPIVKAYVEDNPTGDDYLVVYANGTGYDWFFSGTQAEAMAATDKEADSRWVQYDNSETISSEYISGKGEVVTVTDEAKYCFRLPITIPSAESAFTVPVVAESNTYGDCTARRADIDLDEGTATFGNYQTIIDVAVSSEVDDVQVNEAGSCYYKGYLRFQDEGTITSNEWTSELTMALTDQTYDMMCVTPLLDSSASYEEEASNVDADGEVTIGFTNVYKGVQQIVDGKTATVMMHVADTAPYAEAGTWVERAFVMDTTTGTAVISGEPLTAAKASNSVTVATNKVTKAFKAKKLKSSAKKVALPEATAEYGDPEWTVTKDKSNGALKLMKNGKVKVKKGTAKGTYTMKLKAVVAEGDTYEAAASKVVTVKVTVK